MFLLSWHKFKKSVGAEIRFLHLKPLANNNFHFLSIVKLKSSQLLHSCPNWEEGLEVSSEMNAITLMSDVCCVGMHSHAEWSYLVTDHKFAPLKYHLGGWQFHSKKKVEVTVYEWLPMQEPKLYHFKIFKLMHTCDKFIDTLENSVKNNDSRWICEWQLKIPISSHLNFMT